MTEDEYRERAAALMAANDEWVPKFREAKAQVDRVANEFYVLRDEWRAANPGVPFPKVLQ
ncbi:hypothetical protein ACF1BU_34845 [Streptomyces sp. NPDC014724]|uniref:hypothetical protein n=1 Tax=Actinomycetes TaxID=1760 RepID=UPI000A458BA6|nr:hypothetical protein [Nocardia farcinica]